MKKMLSLLLALVLVLALVPLSVSAVETEAPAAEEEVTYYDKGDDGKWYEVDPVTGNFGSPVTDSELIAALDKVYADYWNSLNAVYEHPHPEDPNDHTLGWASNTKYHWLACACGHQISMEPHVDPKDAENDTCICGYHFSSNADLVTLWVNGCAPIKNFNKNKTEYELTAYTYKDVKEIKISTRTYDSQATVELPEDLTLKQGKNTFEVKVIAENQKDTKTYTLTIIKE